VPSFKGFLFITSNNLVTNPRLLKTLRLAEQNGYDITVILFRLGNWKQMKEADLFWLCWKIGINALWDGSNSHKLLEYLSTGKPVVAHHVSNYRNSNLLYMLATTQNHGYRQFFEQIVEIVKKGKTEELVRKRLQKAIDNSYTKQLRRNESMIDSAIRKS